MRFASLLLLGTCAFAANSSQVLPQPPIRFEPRAPHGGQLGGAEWSARGLGYSLAFSGAATVFHLGDRTLTMHLLGANPAAPFEAASPYSVPTQYFTSTYRGPVQSYRRLRQHQVYPGVDVVYYGNGGNLEYDFEIAPGADPSRIRLRFGGADGLRQALNGDLLVELGGQTITQHAPLVYQTTASGARTPIHAAYQLEANHDVSIRLDGYDTAAPLVIDPIISFAGYLSGSTSNSGVAIAVDAKGFIYVAGNTASADFSATANAFSQSLGGTQNAWLLKLDLTQPPDQVIVYSTYFGGASVDSLTAMTVDANSLVYVAGWTTSTNFPVTGSALQGTNAGTTDEFFSVFDPTQSGSASLLYSTYLGGTGIDEAEGIATLNGKVYVTGSTNSDGFPTSNAIFPDRNAGTDVFVTELDPTQSGAASLVAGSYFGGSGTDYGHAITVDSAGIVYVVGQTYSPDFPITANPFQATSAGGGEAFLLQINLATPLLLHSTYLGGSGTEDARSVLVDPTGKVVLSGYTTSANFPVTQNAFQPLLGGTNATNAFLSILDLTVPAAQAIVYSTYFGGSVGEVAQAMQRDSTGRYALGGYSFSPDLPVTQNALSPVSAGGGMNGFVAVIDPAAPPLNALVYSSYITGPGSQTVNGVDINASGEIYLTGYTTSDILPAGQEAFFASPGTPSTYIFIYTPDAGATTNATNTVGSVRASEARVKVRIGAEDEAH